MITRSGFFRVATTLVIACIASVARADYPEGPIRFIVPYAPGGAVDAFARVLTPELSQRLGQPIVVDNVPGAGGTIGIHRLVMSKPDGYTVGLGIVSDVVLAPLTGETKNYTFKDLAPVAPLGYSGVGVIANPKSGIKSFGQLIAAAKANPGKLNYGATGAGSLPAIVMESVKRRAGIDITFIPYASASKVRADVIGGTLDIGISGLPALIGMIKSGRVNGVGVTSKERDIGAPDLPTAAETPGLEGTDFYFWTGLFAPLKTPDNLVARLNAAFAETLASPKVSQRMRDLGVKISKPMSPKDFGNFVADSNAQWDKTLTEIGAQRK